MPARVLSLNGLLNLAALQCALMSDASLTLDDARRVLGLGPDDGPERLAGAFRRAVKCAHPDRPGGDVMRFREVLEAYRLLQSQAPSPAASDSDVWITVKAPARMLDEGGRLEIDTPAGRKTLWVSRRLTPQRVVRLHGQAPGAQGDLCIRLEPEDEEAESPARAHLRKFAADWAA